MMVFMSLCFLLTACAPVLNPGEVEATATNPTIDVQSHSIPWEVDNHRGGYQFDTESLSCIVIVDNEYKYSSFVSHTNDHKIEFYVGPTEMIVIDTFEGIATYYIETFDDIDQLYNNPVLTIFHSIQSLEYADNGLVEINGVEYREYCATQIVEKQTTEKINYNLYTVKMDWIDGQSYMFQYSEYADGSTLVIGNAPQEINQMINPNTAWVIDMDNLVVKNNESNQEIDLRLVAISTGQGPSPSHSEKVTIEMTHETRVYVDEYTNTIDILQYSKDMDGAVVVLLRDVKITKPVITDDMTEMNSETLESAITLIYMLESLF
jgi:hypothetical protein